MAVYTNDLRLKEIATGDEAGTWGNSTNTNLQLIADAFGFGTEAITTNADTHTTTIADGSADAGRAIFLKYTGTLDSACTITIGPNTVSKLWFIENATSGSQNIIIKQGSGATVTIPAGDTKAIYSDGAGSGGAMVDAFASLNVVDLKVEDDLTVTDDLIVNGDIDLEGSIDVNGTTNLDVVDIDGALTQDGGAVFNEASADVDFRVESNGNQHMLFVDGGNDHVNIGTSTDYGGVVNIETTDNSTNLLLASTDTDANAGPILVLYRQSASSAADGDAIGKIDVLAYNDANQNITYAQIAGLISDASDGSEDGQLQINLMSSASSQSFVDFIGSTGTVFNEGSVVNLDFRVESDGNTHMLFVDSGNDRVMVGKSSTGLANQGVEFEDGQIKGTATGQTVAFLNRASDDGTILDVRKDNSVVGTIGSNSAGGVPTFDISSNSSSGIIRLLTSGSERARIDQAGDVGIGTSTLNKFFNLADPNEGGETLKLHFEASSSADKWAIFSFDRTNSHYAGLSFGANSLVIEGGGNVIVNENSADADFRVESDSNTHAFFVNGEFKSVIGMATSSPVSYANGDTVLYLHGSDNPAIALSDNGQTRDYFITAQGSSLNINYADGSNSSSASNVTTIITFENTGNVGIGRDDPNAPLDIMGSDSGTFSALRIRNSGQVAGNEVKMIFSLNRDGSDVDFEAAGIVAGKEQNWTTTASTVDGFMAFRTIQNETTAERLRITSAGHLLVGTTSTTIASSSGSGNEGVVLGGSLGNAIAVSNGGVLDLNRKTSNGTILEFRFNGASVGSVSTNANSLPSDRNFKTNIKDLSLGLDFVTSLKPVTYNYKIDDEGSPVMSGLIAQDVEECLNDAGVEKNSMTMLQHEPTNDENQSDYKIDYLKLVPVLINAIQEQQELIEILQKKVAALEGGS